MDSGGRYDFGVGLPPLIVGSGQCRFGFSGLAKAAVLTIDFKFVSGLVSCVVVVKSVINCCSTTNLRHVNHFFGWEILLLLARATTSFHHS